MTRKCDQATKVHKTELTIHKYTHKAYLGSTFVSRRRIDGVAPQIVRERRCAQHASNDWTAVDADARLKRRATQLVVLFNGRQINTTNVHSLLNAVSTKQKKNMPTAAA